MPFYRIILILPFLWWAVDAMAQEPEQQMAAPEEWQLTLDVIKSKAQDLVVANNGLHGEYQQLLETMQNLQQSVYDQQAKNEKTAAFIKDRRGVTDQQLRIRELAQVLKIKEQQARVFDGQLKDVAGRQADLDSKIQHLKYAISDIELHQPVKQAVKPVQNPGPQVDAKLGQLRKQLEDESRQEVLLSDQLKDLTIGSKTQNLDLDAISAANTQLEAHLDMLRLQKLQHLEKASSTALAEAKTRRYSELKKRKEELETSIYAYELRMDQLRQSSLTALSWPLKKKRLVHEMVLADARNNQIRDRVKELREDIDLLRDQVGKLERRVNFAQDQMEKP